MKTVSVRDLQKSVRECVDAAQSECVVVTRRGKPAAVLMGVEGKDWETVVLETSPSFWKLIEQRRRQPTISLAEVRRRLDAPAPDAPWPAGRPGSASGGPASSSPPRRAAGGTPRRRVAARAGAW